MWLVRCADGEARIEMSFSREQKGCCLQCGLLKTLVLDFVRWVDTVGG